MAEKKQNPKKMAEAPTSVESLETPIPSKKEPNTSQEAEINNEELVSLSNTPSDEPGFQEKINTQLHQIQANLEDVKNTQDSLYSQLKHVNMFIVKVEEANAAYRSIADSVANNEQEIIRITELTNDLSTKTLTQNEELQTNFTNWEKTNTEKFETLKKEFEDLESVFLKDTNNQIFGLKKRVIKLEESFSTISGKLAEMEKWKKKKELFLFIDFVLAILILIKLFILK